ncbi:SEC-C metal-binding domain-containing protein [Gracilibacillus sp. YIM 98692]|uniref:SEC-C metal-binding domain-containing protein n=1 Tax=Gracilibacillus sp. YIM 98692 TaxID=2663532 RepID=UPI001969E74B|nr:SEC-C metal-binding domain-containing protein [Gracilibacillus sp. YIM 98692]
MMTSVYPDLKDIEKKVLKEEKRYGDKYFKEGSTPLGLYDALMDLTLDDLHQIRQTLEINGISKLKKPELVQYLTDTIPSELQNQISLFDQSLFQVINTTADHNGVYHLGNQLIIDEKHTFWRNHGILFTKRLDEEYVYIMPIEIQQAFLKMKNEVKPAIERNTNWYLLTKGMLEYYGVLTTSDLFEQLHRLKTAPKPEELLDFYRVLDKCSDYHGEILNQPDYFCIASCEEPEELLQVQKNRSDLDFNLFSKQQLLEAGEAEFFQKNRQHTKLVDFLIEQYAVTHEEAEAFVIDLQELLQTVYNTDIILQMFQDAFDIKHQNEIKQYFGLAVDLHNHLKQWRLKGFSPRELSTAYQKTSSNQPVRVIKVGRNEPCPCGSGKKHKKCCGK